MTSNPPTVRHPKEKGDSLLGDDHRYGPKRFLEHSSENRGAYGAICFGHSLEEERSGRKTADDAHDVAVTDVVNQ